jgi:hypothetical protein
MQGAGKQNMARRAASQWFLLGLLLDLEEESDMMFRNTGLFVSD